MSVLAVESFLKGEQDEEKVREHSRDQWRKYLERSSFSTVDQLDEIISGDYEGIIQEKLTENPFVMGEVGLADEKVGNEEPVNAGGSLVQSASSGNPIFFVKLDEDSLSHPLYPDFEDLTQDRGVLYRRDLTVGDLTVGDYLTREAEKNSTLTVEGEGYEMRITDLESGPLGLEYNTQLVITEPTEEAMTIYSNLKEGE